MKRLLLLGMLVASVAANRLQPLSPPCSVDALGVARCTGLVVPNEEDLDAMDLIEVHYDHGINSEPTLVDYTRYFAPIKNQGQCGSCYIFASVAVIEAARNMHLEAAGSRARTPQLSTGDALDCCSLVPGLGTFGCHRCNGGYPLAVMAYASLRGICPAAEYAYHPQFEFCKLRACEAQERVHVRTYGLVKAATHRDLATALDVHGPLVVGLDATRLHDYKKGLFTDCPTGTPDLNHAVALAGLVMKDGKLAWLLRNSWGADFGEDGQFYIPYDAPDDCGILTMAAFVVA